MNDEVKPKIAEAVKNTFALSDDLDFERLSTSDRASQILHLPALLTLLADERSSPKELTTTLEQVILAIKLKTPSDRSELEKRFHEEIKTLIYDPQYEAEEEHQTSSRLGGSGM